MPLPKPKYVLSDCDEILAVNMYEATKSLMKVAARFKVTRQTIRRVMERRGVDVGGRGKRQLRPRVTAAAHLFFVYEGTIPIKRLAKWANVSPDGLKIAIKQVERGER